MAKWNNENEIKNYKDLVMLELTCIADNCITNSEDMEVFDLCADHIYHLVEAMAKDQEKLLERLLHSETERFNTTNVYINL